MNTERYQSLKVHAEESTIYVEIDHGRANEMGRAELSEWEALCQDLEQGQATALVTWSQRRSKKGTPIFISGANVTEREAWSDAEIRAHVRWQRATLARLRAAPVFHVAVVHGVALGWGTEFLLTADYRVSTPEASFALPETGIGILPGAGGTSDLAAVVGLAQALRLGMTGERIDAAEALRIGLVQELAADVHAGLARAKALATQAATRSPTAIASFKAAALAALGRPADARAALEAAAYERCLDSGDAAIGRAAFKQITAGEPVAWGPRQAFKPGSPGGA